MDFDAWCRAKGFDLSTVTPDGKRALQAQWRAELNQQAAVANGTPAQPAAAPQPVPTALPVAVRLPDEPAPVATVTSFDAEWKRAEAEADRQKQIRDMTAKMFPNCLGDPERLKQLRTLCDAAIADPKATVSDYRFAMLKFDTYAGPHVFAPSAPELSGEVALAAVCKTHGLANLDKHFNERVLDAADRRFRSGLTLCNLLGMAARQAGYRGDFGGESNLLAMWKHIGHYRRAVASGELMAAGSGLSTLDITGILSNTANKFMAEQFLYGEQSFRKVSKIRTATDFKTMTTYRLTGSNKFIKVAPGGELKHGTLGELSYENKVDTYGILLGIDRRDFINDDLGALAGRSGEVGQGAIDSLNEVWYTEWLDDSTFFPTDKSKNNYDDGATDSVLTLAGLANADNIFGLQTKPNGTPLGAQPRILFVPRALRTDAVTLMADAPTAAAQSTPTTTIKNPWAGMFDVVDSVYLQSSAISGSSALAWYLMADPNNLAAIEVAFLFGKEMPTIEESELPFDRLGMSLRAYMDFGVKKQEYRAAVKLKGAA